MNELPARRFVLEIAERVLRHSERQCRIFATVHLPAWVRAGCQGRGGMKKLAGVSIVFVALTAMLVVWGGSAVATNGDNSNRAQMSGSREFGDEELGTNITECPQAGIDDNSLRRTKRDEVERLSERGDDIRLNQDYACMPQDEMSIAVNPTDTDQRLRRGQRLSTRMGLIRLLCEHRSRSRLERRDRDLPDAGPVSDAASSEGSHRRRRRPDRSLRSRRNCLLRADPFRA